MVSALALMLPSFIAAISYLVLEVSSRNKMSCVGWSYGDRIDEIEDATVDQDWLYKIGTIEYIEFTGKQVGKSLAKKDVLQLDESTKSIRTIPIVDPSDRINFSSSSIPHSCHFSTSHLLLQLENTIHERF
jgi:hypothetical protein